MVNTASVYMYGKQMGGTVCMHRNATDIGSEQPIGRRDTRVHVIPEDQLGVLLQKVTIWYGILSKY